MSGDKSLQPPQLDQVKYPHEGQLQMPYLIDSAGSAGENNHIGDAKLAIQRENLFTTGELLRSRVKNVNCSQIIE